MGFRKKQIQGVKYLYLTLKLAILSLRYTELLKIMQCVASHTCNIFLSRQYLFTLSLNFWEFFLARYIVRYLGKMLGYIHAVGWLVSLSSYGKILIFTFYTRVGHCPFGSFYLPALLGPQSKIFHYNILWYFLWREAAEL